MKPSRLLISFTSTFFGLAAICQADQIAVTKTLKPVTQKENEKPKVHEISWSEIEYLSQQLAKPLGGKKWDGILAITRGGLIPAGLLAQSLKIRRIEAINIASYDKENKRGDLSFLNKPDIKNQGENWIVLDDLVDSGKTIEAVKKLYPKAVYAVIFAKPQGLPTVDHYVQKFDQDTWIVFPWEKWEKSEAKA